MATPQKDLRDPIILVLGDLGGQATKERVLDEIERRGLIRPSEDDRVLVSSGEERWRNRAAWERNALVEEGLLYSPSYGEWGLTPVGWEAHAAIQDAAPAKRNPPWGRDEDVLALDVYVSHGCLNGGTLLWRDDPAVVELSEQLKGLPLHPPSSRAADFRNPPGVALKLANFRALERDVRLEMGEPGAVELPSGMSAYSRLDRAVFDEFFGAWDDLHQEAQAIRQTLTPGTPSATAGGEQKAVDAPVDGGGQVEYESSTVTTGSRTRSEAMLVEHYARHMADAGHEVVGRHYRVRSESRVLRADLFVRDLGVLVEAKATISRNSIRLGIGQVLDYRRFEDPEPAVALLLPDKPSTDMLALLDDLDIGCVWPTTTGYRDTREGSLAK